MDKVSGFGHFSPWSSIADYNKEEIIILKKVNDFIKELFQKKILNPNDVFMPGGIPSYTYIPREKHDLDKLLVESLQGKKIVIVTGQTKSGKSVLVSRTIKKPHIWIDGGSIDQINDFWDQMAMQLNTFNKQMMSELQSQSHNTSSVYSLSIFDLGIKSTDSLINTIASTMASSREVSNKAAVLNVLNNVRIPLIIDDFHYIDREQQLNIVRAIKNPVLKGFPVILIAIPHRKFDPIRVEREISGRTEIMSIPYWEDDELLRIPQIGFPLLNIKINENHINEFVSQSLGSPHLMQEFCLKYAKNGGVINNDFFYEIAVETCRIVFEKLLQGPRQRTDRKIYTLKTGEETDIYGVILFSLSTLKPGLQTYVYEDIRTAIRESIKDSLPASNQISRTLKYMSEIAISDESSTPVIDWEADDNLLHITDPYFAFFLRWGLIKGLKSA